MIESRESIVREAKADQRERWGPQKDWLSYRENEQLDGRSL